MWKISSIAFVLAFAPLASVPHADAQQQQQQRPPQQRQSQPQSQQAQPQEMGGQQDVSALLEDFVMVRLAEKAWVGGDFKATVNNGRLTLSGTVPSERTKERISRIARKTIGITEVQNNLRVDPATGAGTPVADAELVRRVARNIASAIDGAKAGEDWWFQGWRVEGPNNVWSFIVEAENGRVYLEGDVPRLDLMRKAVDAARQTSGVQSVRADLELDRIYAGYPGYWRFPHYAHPYHAYDPYAFVPAYSVDVDVVNGKRTRSTGPHTITGEVTAIDRQQGRVTLKTDDGTVHLPLPASALQGVREGEEMTIRVGIGDAPAAASPPTGSQRMDSKQMDKKR